MCSCQRQGRGADGLWIGLLSWQLERAEAAIKSLEEEVRLHRDRHGQEEAGDVAWWEWLLVQVETHPTNSSGQSVLSPTAHTP